MGENEVVKIRFRLLQGADGYPPCDSEGLWATPLGGGAYRVANLPWFVPDVALGDVVRAVADGDGILWAVERTEESGNCTIRVRPWMWISGPSSTPSVRWGFTARASGAASTLSR